MDNIAAAKNPRFTVTGYVWGTLQDDGRIIWNACKESAVSHAALFRLAAVQVEYNREGEARVRDLSTRKLLPMDKIQYVGV